jgi:thiamine pyrophosphate-dependent acetolactate synthase large subunit-like protein
VPGSSDIPVTWVIFNDGEYKLVKLYQIATYGESALVDLANLGLRGLCEGGWW